MVTASGGHNFAGRAVDGDIIVLEFGGSVLRAPGDAPAAVHEIYRWYRAGWRVVAVAASIGAALERAGIPARVIDARDMDLLSPTTQIELLETLLNYTPVLVVDLGPHAHGSDLLAVYLAKALRAGRCRLLKDVDNAYEADPDDAGAHDAPAVLQGFSALGHADTKMPPPTTVLILGLDDLGVSIHRRVSAMSEHFRVIGTFDQTEPVDAVMSLHPEVVVDVLSGTEPAHSLVSHFLERGASAVSANLALIADAGRKLSALAARYNTYFRYNASVGGSAPMMEALRREAQQKDIRSIAVVFSGEAGRILDRCSKGFSFEELLLNATAELGTEAIHQELSGIASARKLCVLARHAFGHDPDAFRVTALNAETLARARNSLSENCTLRLVARAWKISHRVFAQLQMEALDTRDPLAQVLPEWNRLVINHCNTRQTIVQGREGRWPTAEAVMADLLDVRFAQLALSKPATWAAP